VSYRIAGIDVHKTMLAVVVADVAVEGGYDFERRQFGSSPEQLRLLTEWLVEQKIQEVVMESTAQYWRPVWQTLERYWKAECQRWEGALVRCLERCTWRRRSPIAGRGDARKISPTPDVSSGGWWHWS
jgi:hypothetical protein